MVAKTCEQRGFVLSEKLSANKHGSTLNPRCLTTYIQMNPTLVPAFSYSEGWISRTTHVMTYIM